MKKEVWIGKKGFRYWYYKFRDSEYYSFTLIGGTVLVCVLLIFLVIVPEVSSWFSIRDEVVATRERIRVLKDNLAFVNTMDRNKLSSEIDTATTALPLEKDFDSILAVISDAAISSGVAMNDFSFTVGAVDGKAKKDTKSSGLETMRVTVVLSGSVQNVRKFISQVEKSLPLAEIVAIDGTDQSVALTVQFYQKGFPPIKVNDDQPLSTLPAEKLGILQKLQTMKKPMPVMLPSTNASGGAMPLF